MRKPIIAANWKMNKTLPEATGFVEKVVNQLPEQQKVDTVVCSPALFLPSLTNLAAKSNLAIGAQTMHFEDSGAFTGEISPKALANINVTYVIVGHSERRQLFGETDSDVNNKTIAAFRHNLIPIVCVGETIAEREANETNQVVGDQVVAALKGLTIEQAEEVIIAYEPVWAIGTGKSSSADDANEVCSYIRSVIAKEFSEQVAGKIRIQYGGSVNPSNIAEYLAKEHIDGALVGGASLEVESFLQLVEAAANE